MSIGNQVLVTDVNTGLDREVDIDWPMPIADEVHLRVENGDTFMHNNVHLAVANLATLDHLLVTGADPIHLTIWGITATNAPALLDLREGVTVSANGTPAPLLNKNRTSTKTTEVLMYEDPTITDIGTHLEGDFVGGSKQTGGEGSGNSTQWMLAPNTNYLLRVTNQAGQAMDISVHIEFYQESH